MTLGLTAQRFACTKVVRLPYTENAAHGAYGSTDQNCLANNQTMLFFSFFKTLVDQEIIIELKNNIEIKGTLVSVDQYLNLKLDNISTVNETKYPHLKAVKTLFIRGSTVRYVHLSASSVDCTLLQDASRRGMLSDHERLLNTQILTKFRSNGRSRQIKSVIQFKIAGVLTSLLDSELSPSFKRLETKPNLRREGVFQSGTNEYERPKTHESCKHICTL